MFKNFQNYIRSIFASKEIRKKLWFSLLVIFIFRVLAAIPVAGIPADAISQLFEIAGGEFGDIVSTISGGVLETASVVAIGLTPYINASIILQLLSSVLPKLEQLRKEGSEGRRKISMYTRYLTIPLAVLNSFVIYSSLRGFGLIDTLPALELVAMIVTLTGGAVLMMWIGELVSESGLGNGSSYLIFLGVISAVPGSLRSNFQTMDSVQISIVIGFFLLLIASVIFISEAERRVKVQYSRRVRTGQTLENYIPIKLTQFGVMPVIFAISFFSFPQYIAQFLIGRDISSKVTEVSQKIILWLSDPYVYNIGIFLLVVAFSFFYVTVVFNTQEWADNLQKQGAFIPGIRPGDKTADYLRGISFRLTSVGALFLGLLAILPSVLTEIGLLQTAVMSGTGLLIGVGVLLDIKRQIESMVVVRNYDSYM